MYYVYLHREPTTKEIKYVGFGTMGRAWVCHSRNNKDHFKWLEDIQNTHTLDEVVEIVFKSNDKQKALEIERQIIDLHKPEFNYTDSWSWCMVLDDDQIALAKALRQDGMSYSAIAKEIESSTMTVYRMLNGRTKGYNGEH